MSIAIITAGFTGVGKTTYVKNKIIESERPEFIYDINKEYNMRGSFFGDFKEFLQKAKEKKDSIIVFEEATIFFKQQAIERDMMQILVLKRHMGKDGCIIILNFHSLRKIPLDIMDLCNYLVIFKTNDMPNRVLQKFEDWRGIYDAYNEVNEAESDHFYKTIKLK